MTVTYVLSGALGGLLIGLTGVGGGSIMTPLLVLGFGISPATAIGTDLLYAAFTKASAVWFHHRRGNVDWRTGGRLLLGSLPGSLLTIWLLPAAGADLDRLLKGGLGIALVLTVLALWRPRTQLSQSFLSNPKTAHRFTLLTGALLGALVTLSSVGGGALGTALLMMLYPRWGFARVVGTELAHAVPLTLMAGLGHLSLGHVDPSLLASLLLGAFPGLWIGVRLNHRIPEKTARQFLSVLLIGLAASLLGG